MHQFDTSIVQANYTKKYTQNKPSCLEASIPKQHFSSSIPSTHYQPLNTYDKPKSGNFSKTYVKYVKTIGTLLLDVIFVIYNPKIVA